MVGELHNTLLIIADISGYTKFMTQTRVSIGHSQAIISELINSILREVDIPLDTAKLEGDAVFIYAKKDTDWEQHKSVVSAKILRFFTLFTEKLAELVGSNLCSCNPCANASNLKLKVIVHGGQALFYKIGKFEELAGPDVITLHRLLKNTVNADHYLLLTDAAKNDLAIDLPFTVHNEKYDVGDLTCHVHLFEPTPSTTDYSGASFKLKNAFLKTIKGIPGFLGRNGTHKQEAASH